MRHRVAREKGVTLDRLAAFLEVVDAGGMARLAAGDPARQSLLSRQLGELRAFFGQELLVRQGRARVPTEAGRRLAAIVREAFQGLDDLAAQASQAQVSVLVGAGDSVLQWLVIPKLRPILAAVPRATVRLRALASADVVEQLLDARLDAGVVRGPVPRGLRSRRLGSITYALFVPRVARTRGEPLETILARVPLALQQSEPEVNAAVPARAALECETFPQAVAAVRSGQFAALLPGHARTVLPATEYDEIVLPAPRRTCTSMSVAWRAATATSRPVAMQVITALAAQLSRSLAAGCGTARRDAVASRRG